MPQSSFTNELLRLHELLEKGAITKEEYEEQKSRLFNEIHNSDSEAEEGQSNNESSESNYKVPQIIISQNTSSSTESTAIAKAKNGGFLKTILAVIGFFVVLGIVFAIFSINNNKKDTAKEQPQTEAASAEEEQNSDEGTTEDDTEEVDSEEEESDDDDYVQLTPEQLQEKLKEVKTANVTANNNINAVWKGMDPDVRDYLTPDQLAWNKDKVTQCETSDYETPTENQIVYLDCLNNLTSDRAEILQKQQEELLPKIKEEKLKKVKLEALNSGDTLKETWDSLQDSIKDQLRPDFDKWNQNLNKQCDSVNPAETQVQTDINHYVCLNKLIKIKTKELNGYKI